MPIVVLCVNCVVLKNQFSRPQFSLEAGNMHPKVKNEEVGDWSQRRRFPARPFMDLFDCGNLDQMHLVLMLYILHWTLYILHSRQRIKKEGTRPRFCQIVGIWRRIHFLSLFVSRDASKFDAQGWLAPLEMRWWRPPSHRTPGAPEEHQRSGKLSGWQASGAQDGQGGDVAMGSRALCQTMNNCV